MRTMKLGASSLTVPVIAIGAMRITELDAKEAENYVASALEMGLNFFDHADIYGGGHCEEIFADAVHMSPSVREKLIIQSKCGICHGEYDFSKQHILEAVDGSLRRLKTDYLDSLLLHRPDALMDPEEVAEAFDTLYSAGKVRNFGVSNENPGQIKLLQKYIRHPIAADQLQFSITNATMISRGTNVNMENDRSLDRDGGILDFCRLNDITIQAWSPFQYGFFAGPFIGNDKFKPLNDKLTEIAAKYGVTPTTIAVAWILRHPAHIQPIVGTMNLDRLRQCAAAADITLTHHEWYEIFLSAGNKLP